MHRLTDGCWNSPKHLIKLELTCKLERFKGKLTVIVPLSGLQECKWCRHQRSPNSCPRKAGSHGCLCFGAHLGYLTPMTIPFDHSIAQAFDRWVVTDHSSSQVSQGLVDKNCKKPESGVVGQQPAKGTNKRTDKHLPTDGMRCLWHPEVGITSCDKNWPKSNEK